MRQILRWIADGDCYQLNLTFPLTFQLYGHPLALYTGLRERQPVRYGGYVDTAEATILSFSPELFFERCGTRVVTRPMKGTAARGDSLLEDEARRAALLSSTKERAENIMIVDLLRNDLGRLAKPGGVSVTALCEAAVSYTHLRSLPLDSMSRASAFLTRSCHCMLRITGCTACRPEPLRLSLIHI